MQPATINRHVAHAAWKDLPMMGDRLPHTGRSGDLDCPCGFKGEHHVLVVAAKGDRLGDVVAVENVEDRAKVVSLDEIKEEGWTLNISRYVLPLIGADIPPLPEAVAAFKEALTEARAAEDDSST